MSDTELKNEEEKLETVKSVSSIIISLLSVIGIVFTIVIYYIVSPSLSNLEDTSGHLLDGVVETSKLAKYNSNYLYSYYSMNKYLLGDLKELINTSYENTVITHEILNKMSAKDDEDYSEYKLRLKNNEDKLTELRIRLGAYELEEPSKNAIDEKIDDILSYSTKLRVSLGSLNTLFTGFSVIVLIIFISLIVLSTEDLIS